MHQLAVVWSVSVWAVEVAVFVVEKDLVQGVSQMLAGPRGSQRGADQTEVDQRMTLEVSLPPYLVQVLPLQTFYFTETPLLNEGTLHTINTDQISLPL